MGAKPIAVVFGAAQAPSPVSCRSLQPPPIACTLEAWPRMYNGEPRTSTHVGSGIYHILLPHLSCRSRSPEHSQQPFRAAGHAGEPTAPGARSGCACLVPQSPAPPVPPGGDGKPSRSHPPLRCCNVAASQLDSSDPKKIWLGTLTRVVAHRRLSMASCTHGSCTLQIPSVHIHAMLSGSAICCSRRRTLCEVMVAPPCY